MGGPVWYIKVELELRDISSSFYAILVGVYTILLITGYHKNEGKSAFMLHHIWSRRELRIHKEPFGVTGCFSLLPAWILSEAWNKVLKLSLLSCHLQKYILYIKGRWDFLFICQFIRDFRQYQYFGIHSYLF